MRHFFCLVLFSTFSLLVLAQRPYQPMVVEGATWVQKTTSYETGLPQRFAVRIMEDTVIEGKQYRALYSIPLVDIDNTIADLTQKFLHGFLREDTVQKQVFFRSNSLSSVICNENIGDEVLLYDFSVKVGDSTHTCMNNNAHRPDTVVNISYVDHFLDIPVFGLDTMMLVELADSMFLTTEKMYFEAVGNTFGPTGIQSYPGYVFGFVDRALAKYCRHDSLCNIQIVTSLENPIRSTKPLEIHPNVVTHGQIIPLIQELERLTLIATSGKKISISPHERTFSIPLSCTPGLYYLIGVDIFKNTYTQKIIVQ